LINIYIILLLNLNKIFKEYKIIFFQYNIKMYEFIREPNSGRQLSINSTEGKNLLKNYIMAFMNYRNEMRGGMEARAEEGGEVPTATPILYIKDNHEAKVGLSVSFDEGKNTYSAEIVKLLPHDKKVKVRLLKKFEKDLSSFEKYHEDIFEDKDPKDLALNPHKKNFWKSDEEATPAPAGEGDRSAGKSLWFNKAKEGYSKNNDLQSAVRLCLAEKYKEIESDKKEWINLVSPGRGDIWMYFERIGVDILDLISGIHLFSEIYDPRSDVGPLINEFKKQKELNNKIEQELINITDDKEKKEKKEEIKKVPSELELKNFINELKSFIDKLEVKYEVEKIISDLKKPSNEGE